MMNLKQLALSLFSIGKQMCDEGCYCIKVEEDKTTLTFIVDRRGRDDEEIATLMRGYKVMIVYAYEQSCNGTQDIKLRYKIAKSADELAKALQENGSFVESFLNNSERK